MSHIVEREQMKYFFLHFNALTLYRRKIIKPLLFA